MFGNYSTNGICFVFELRQTWAQNSLCSSVTWSCDKTRHQAWHFFCHSLFDQIIEFTWKKEDEEALQNNKWHVFDFLSSPPQFSTNQVSMEEITTAVPPSPAVEAHPSCVSAVGRFVGERWCESKTHTSTCTASPAKVTKPPTTHPTHTNSRAQCSILLLFSKIGLIPVFPCVDSTHLHLHD